MLTEKRYKMLKERKYKVTFRGETRHARVELHESGAFAYGNKTAVLYYDGTNENPKLFDTRYEIGIIKNFEKWADEFIKTQKHPDCIIEVE